MKPTMKFAFSSEETAKVRADVLAVPVFDDEPQKERIVVALDKALGGLVARLIEEERFKGKKGQTLAFITHGKIAAARVALLGVGSRKDFQPTDMRPVAARAAKLGLGASAKHLAIALPEMDRPAQERAVQLAT